MLKNTIQYNNFQTFLDVKRCNDQGKREYRILTENSIGKNWCASYRRGIVSINNTNAPL